MPHRFFMNCPEPQVYTAEDIMNAPELPCSLDVIFFFIYRLNLDEPNIYTLSEDGALKFNEFYNENRALSKAINSTHKDPFVGYNLSN